MNYGKGAMGGAVFIFAVDMQGARARIFKFASINLGVVV
jgi:hypothetical protein